MAVMDNYVEGWKKWNDFAGKTPRAGFWWFVLINIIVALICSKISPVLGGVYSLASFIPNLSITIRRLHDVKKSGWWCAPVFIWWGALALFNLGLGKIPLFSFLGLIVGALGAPIALVFAIVLIVFLIQKSL